MLHLRPLLPNTPSNSSALEKKVFLIFFYSFIVFQLNQKFNMSYISGKLNLLFHRFRCPATNGKLDFYKRRNMTCLMMRVTVYKRDNFSSMKTRSLFEVAKLIYPFVAF